MSKTTTLLLLLAVVGGTMAQNYCALCRDHTMCKYKGPGPKCGRIIRSGLSSADRAKVLAAHNELRTRVAAGLERAGSNGGQPGAANMREMVWDKELATIAQRWTDQCNFGTDSCRKTSKYKVVGQNVFLSKSSHGRGANWRGVVKAWYSEVKDFNKNNIAPYRSSNRPVVGHYTQVVWAETTRVGCGFTQFPEGGWIKSVAVCNYGPGGNVVGKGRTMYTPGRACSQCPGKTICKNSLCGW